MEELNEANEMNLRSSSLLNKYFKPNYQDLMKKIQTINTPLKNDIIQTLLDGQWHSESELIRIAKQKERVYIGSVTVGTMINNVNSMLKSTYLERKYFNGENWYKISDNYVGLSRAAYNKYRFKL